MPRNQEKLPRCPRCRMHLALCFCEALKTIPTQTRVSVLQHPNERYKVTNTGHLVPKLLKNGALHQLSKEGRLGYFPQLSAQEANYLLFPHPEATALNQLTEEHPQGVHLWVVDASWRQARRMVSRWPGFQSMPFASLSEIPKGRFRVRNYQGDQEGLCTLEAVAHSLAVLECQWVADSLLETLDTMVGRILQSRGVSEEL